MPVVSKPGQDGPRSALRFVLPLAIGGLVALGLLGTWIYGKVMAVVNQLECRDSVSVQATGPTGKAAGDAAERLWREKVTATYGPEAVNSGIKLNMVQTCTGWGEAHTCVLRAEPCLWKK